MLDKIHSIEIVKTFIRELKDSGFDLYKAILFGSSARDEMIEWSDIDLAIVSNQFSTSIIDNIRLYANINIKYPDIETHPFSTDTFLISDLFIEEIKKTGIEIEL